MSRPGRQQNVLDLLKGLRGIEPLKQLFWSELNYQRVNQPLSRRGWMESAGKTLADDPVLFAGGGENNDFHVIYSRLASDKLLLGSERPVVSRLLNEHPYTLFVFSNAAQDRWHFLNVKYDETSDKRRLFRRITVGPEERLRTASERISLLSLDAISPELFGLAPLTIQQHHDEAFDVEAVTKKFFDDFCQIFTKVAKDIRERNKWMDGEAVERETQTLLNRLLFLYFIQRKGWMNRQRDYLYANFKQNHAAAPEGTNYYSEFLCRLFIRLSTEGEYFETLGDLPFLNGGLFNDEYGGQQRQEVLLRRARMKIGNDIFRRVFDDLLEAYNFTVREDTPLNQEVAIDPEMLGKIFESLVLQIEQSDTGGKTSRHDTGSYYTPRPIVHYLCREGLRGRLEQQPPVGVSRESADWPARLEKLLALDASDGIDADERATLDICLSPEEARALLERLDNLRACDPAVGSGAFPVGLLHEVLNLRRLCEMRSRGRDPVEGDRNWLYDTKARIIERVIYGVDIQERAIEICKLRLWLSLMVDFDPGVNIEDCSAKAFADALKKIPALPNLDFKIRRANSLIDMVRGHPVNMKHGGADEKGMLPPILNKLITAKREFYDAHKMTDKRRLRFNILDATAELAMYEFSATKTDIGLIPDEKDSARVAELAAAEREMGWLRQQIRAARKRPAAQQDEELERLSQKFDDPAHPTFVWQLDFAEVFHHSRASENHKPRITSGLLQKAPPLIKSGFDLVLGNPPYGIVFNLAEKEILEHKYPTFERNNDKYIAFTHCGMTLLSERGNLAFIMPNTFLLGPYFDAFKKHVLPRMHILKIVDFGINQVFADPNVFTALLFLRARDQDEKGPALGSIFGKVGSIDSFPTSIAFQPLSAEQLIALRWTPANELVAKLQKAKIKLGDVAWVKDVGLNYWTEGRGKKRGGSIADRVLYAGQRADKNDKSYIKGRDIDKYAIKFSNRWLRHNYESLLDPEADTFRFSPEFLECEKIVYRQTADELIATIDHNGMLVDKTLHVVVVKSAWKAKIDLRYLLGLLNSQLLTHVYRANSQEEGRTFAQVKIFRVRELPIPDANEADRSAIVMLVQRCLDAKGQGPRVAEWQAEINDHVARLYGLTENEIKLVQESAEH